MPLLLAGPDSGRGGCGPGRKDGRQAAEGRSGGAGKRRRHSGTTLIRQEERNEPMNTQSDPILTQLPVDITAGSGPWS